MRVIILKTLAIFMILGGARAQIELKFGQFDTRVPDKTFIDNENLNLNKPTIILENAIDPEKYIIGSGDVFGININTMEKMFFSSTVGPAGDVLGIMAKWMPDLIVEGFQKSAILCLPSTQKSALSDPGL